MSQRELFEGQAYKSVRITRCEDCNPPESISGSFDLAAVHAVKILGRAIGAASEILDGDGDGFYTPFEGAPDKTPVPAHLARQAAKKPKKGKRPNPLESDPTEKVQDPMNEAWKGLRAELGEIRRSHNRIRTQADAFKVLKQYFPNLEEEPPGSGYAPSYVLGEHHKSVVYSLILSAKRFPDATKRIRGINLEGDSMLDADPELQAALGAHTVQGFGEQKLYFSSKKLKYYSDNWRKQKDEDLSYLAVGAAQKDLKFGANQQLDMFILGIVAHEMGHAQHAARRWDHLGFNPIEDSKEDFFKKVLGFSDDELKKLLRRAQARIQIDNDIEGTNYSMDERTIWMMALKLTVDSHLIPAWDSAAFDSLTQEEISASLDAMGTFSPYARVDHDEATAEALSSGILRYMWTPEMQKLPMIKWLLEGTLGMTDDQETKQAKQIKPKSPKIRFTSEGEIYFHTCTGVTPTPPKKS